MVVLEKICTLMSYKNGNYNYFVIKQANAVTGDNLQSSVP